MKNKLYSTFFSGHFLFDKCTVYGKVPEIVSVDLYQSLNSSSGTTQSAGTAPISNGADPIQAYIPVEITLPTMSSYSSQSLAITSLCDISW